MYVYSTKKNDELYMPKPKLKMFYFFTADIIYPISILNDNFSQTIGNIFRKVYFIVYDRELNKLLDSHG